MKGAIRLICENHASSREIFGKHETRDSLHQYSPSPDLSPRIAQRRRSEGRGEGLAGTLTQGSARGSCPRSPWASFRRPLQGFKMEQRPPCRCTF